MPVSTAALSLPAGVKAAPVNGYDMAYVEKSAGNAVVFAHGMLMDYPCFMAQMDPFAAKHRAIAVSLRHYYPARWDGRGTFSLAQHIDDVIAHRTT